MNIFSSFKATNEDYRPGMDGGKIAAIIIGVLAAIIFFVIILIKLYGKKFRRAGAAGKTIEDIIKGNVFIILRLSIFLPRLQL